jgi:hypothetical protein
MSTSVLPPLPRIESFSIALLLRQEFVAGGGHASEWLLTDAAAAFSAKS